MSYFSYISMFFVDKGERERGKGREDGDGRERNLGEIPSDREREI